MTAPLRLETDRLLLVRPSAADADEVFTRYASDPEVTRYVGWPRHASVADTRSFLAFSADQWDRDGVGPYLIRSKTDGLLLGSTGLGRDGVTDAMTGYVLARDVWGQGFATEALRAMVDLALAIGVLRLYALCHPDHRASWRVLEKCGFVRDTSWTRKIVFPNLAPDVEQNALCYVAVF